MKKRLDEDEIIDRDAAVEDTSDEPNQGQIVYADLNEPFERPAREFVAGPLYKDVVEVEPELEETETAEAEGSDLPVDRRDFMRMFSATAMLGAASGCVYRPEEKIVPHVNQPVDHVVGVSNYYATTCNMCQAACGLVVETRGGRPVKIEGSPEHPISQGSTCALGQGQLQGLYHPERRKVPVARIGGQEYEQNWDDIFEALASRLNGSKKVAIFSGGSTGNRLEFFERWLEKIGSSKDQLYTFEPNNVDLRMSEAHKIAFGAEGVPRPALESANLIVGVGADFLDVGLSPVYMTKTFSARHTYRMGNKGRFVQFESGLSLTGSKSDDRYVIPVGGELGMTLALVRSLLAAEGSKGSASERAEIQKVINQHESYINEVIAASGIPVEEIDQLAEDMIAESAVVLCGSTAEDENGTILQLAAIMANVLIDAYTSTLNFEDGWMRANTRSGDLTRFLENADDIDFLIVIDSNPAFTVPQAFGISEKIKKIKNVVSIQYQNTETDALANFVLPGRHGLESWGDEEIVAGFWSVRQPTIRATTDSRQAEDILLWLAAAAQKPLGYKDYRDYLHERWQGVYKLVSPKVEFDVFWKAVLRRGFVGKLSKRTVRSFGAVADKINPAPFTTGLKLVSPLDVRLRDGRGADMPVLQEAGDGITTVAWDTYVAMHPETAKRLGFKRNDLLRLEANGRSIEVALYPLPGMHRDAIYVNRGNGRNQGVNLVTDGYGVNPVPLMNDSVDPFIGTPVFAGIPVKITATGKRYALAALQKHNDIANRSDIVKKMTLDKVKSVEGTTVDLDSAPNLYPELPEHADYRWGMAIDLTACTGCQSCVVACDLENNVPQLGRQQILRGREMHWIRIDRYFAGPMDNPEVTFQPMLCQHCNHAPCEPVCPVFATSHDPEGMNQQTYNRCVGTRYCANACPYKVRRFNWFTHKWNVVGTDESQRNIRALNPDVTVRTRGVMEKCTFCVQRVRDGKHKAKERGDKVRDGEIKTACSQVCPSNAIVFGNIKDTRSRVARLRKDPRAYAALNGDPAHGHYGIKTWPNVSYLAQVTLKESAINKVHHGGNENDNHHDGNDHG